MKTYQIEYSLFLVDDNDEYILETWIELDANSIDEAQAQIEKVFDRCIENLVSDDIQEEYDSIGEVIDSALNILTINRVDDGDPENNEVIHRDFTNEGPNDDGDYIKYHDTIWNTELANIDDDYEPMECPVYDK